MRIAVCVKQVPARSDGLMDPETRTIRREPLEAVMNPCDAVAVETALRVKGAVAGVADAVAAGGAVDVPEAAAALVSVFSMGPLSAAAVVREALGMGADEGYLLSDAGFAGADVFATAYTLVQGMRQAGGFDLIVCGRQTTDGGTAQVGGTLAQLLGVPHLGAVSMLIGVDERQMTVVQETEREYVTLRAGFPCVVSVEPALFTPRVPSLRGRLAAMRRRVPVMALDDLRDTDAAHYGRRGSPTRVERIYQVPLAPTRDLLELEAAPAADLILDLIGRRPRSEANA